MKTGINIRRVRVKMKEQKMKEQKKAFAKSKQRAKKKVNNEGDSKDNKRYKIVIWVILCIVLIGLCITYVILKKNTDSLTPINIEKDKQKISEEETAQQESLESTQEIYAVKIMKDPDFQSAYNEVRNAIVKIDMGEYSGSGVILRIDEEKILIVSSGHLLSHYESGAVCFTNADVAVGWVKGISQESDVGFMEVYTSDLDKSRLAYLKQATYDIEVAQNLKKQDAIFQVGSTSGVAADVYEGSVASTEWYFEEFEDTMIYNYCKATPGMSGGGMFTNQGYLVGIVSGSYLEESCALPLSSILDAMEELDIVH